MAVTASYDRTANTEGRSVDSVLHPMLMAKSQFIDRLKVGAKVDEPKVEWVSAQKNSRIVTGVADSTNSTVDTAAGTNLLVSAADADKLQVGCIIRNASIATPLGTYKVDELMKVIAKESPATAHTDITLLRDYGHNGPTNNEGFATHIETNTFEILYTPKAEGSSPDRNMYMPTVLSDNYTTILDFYLTATGTEMARRPLIAADNMANQYDNRTTELARQVSSLVFYGSKNMHTAAGSSTETRTTQGLLQAISVAGSLLDYATTAVTETTLNTLFENLYLAGNAMSANYAIVTHPKHARVITGFGEAHVQITQSEKAWGRYVNTFISDLGSTAEVIPDPTVSKSNLFLVNLDKLELVPFRPWLQLEWGIDTSTPDGTDAYKKRILGEYTVKVTDPLTSHAGMGLLSW